MNYRIILPACLTLGTLTGCQLVPAQHTSLVQAQQPLKAPQTKPDTEKVAQPSDPQRKADTAASPVMASQNVESKQEKPTKPQPTHALALLQQKMQWGKDAPRSAQLYKKHIQRHPKHVARVFKRAQWFLPHIIKQLQAQNMPLELALLPYVESGFNPVAHSWQGAAGIWQFTRGTGEHMGLKINWWYDERRDLEASTAAALKYLNYLHQQTGDWYLALAAYNAGLGNVFRAQRYYAKKHHGKKPTNFWQIRRYLPGETQHYVPALLGVVAYLQEADLNKLPQIPLESPAEKLELPQQVDLNKIAATAKVDHTTFKLLNAAHLRKVTPPSGPHRLYLPKTVLANINPLIKQKPTLFAVKLQRYKIRNGDSLSVIAHRFGTTTRHLMQLNHLKTAQIGVGKTLLVPATHATHQQAKRTPEHKRKGIKYKVKPGETLWDIALRYNLKTRTLAQYNRLSVRQPLRVGQTLYIPVKHLAAKKQTEKKKLTHTVKPGESLWLVARQYGASVKALRRWNDLPARFTLRPGQKLVIWTNKASAQQDS